MELAEALRTLGLTDGAEFDAPELKRAYLKQVKLHPPEADPVGFQRVREAYELLRGLPPRAFPALRVVRERPLPSATEPAEPLQPQATPPLVENDAELRDEAPGADDAWGEGAFELPVEPEQEREQGGTVESIATQPGPDGRSSYERMQDALRDQRPKAAASAMLELYAQADLAAQVAPPPIVLDTILRLFMAGANKRARTLFTAFEQHMALVATPLGPAIAAQWQLLGELDAVSRSVAPELTRALAGAIQSGQFQAASEALRIESFAVGRDRLRATMKARAPTLFSVAWSEPAPKARASSGSGIGWAVRVALLALYGLSRAFSHDDVSARPYETSSSRLSAPASYVSPPAASTVNPLALAGPESQPLSEADRERLQPLVGKAEAAYLAGKCDELMIAWAEFLIALRQLPRARDQSLAYAYHRARAVAVCPELASELPEQP